MARYRVYSWHGVQLVEADEIEADGDSDAIRIARERGLGDYSEIWQADRRVRTVAPQPARSTRA